MFRRTMLLLALSTGIYLLLKQRDAKAAAPEGVPHEADAQWANEGGANAPANV
ncbi:MAG: hypothetical protein M3O06_07490 [Pseudomonadota bacterium]|nr:hypothetical protein [Pseudomonadota bacterium]